MPAKTPFALGGEQYEGQPEDTAGMGGGMPAPPMSAPVPKAPPVKPFAGKFGKGGKGKPFAKRK